MGCPFASTLSDTNEPPSNFIVWNSTAKSQLSKLFPLTVPLTSCPTNDSSSEFNVNAFDTHCGAHIAAFYSYFQNSTSLNYTVLQPGFEFHCVVSTLDEILNNQRHNWVHLSQILVKALDSLYWKKSRCLHIEKRDGIVIAVMRIQTGSTQKLIFAKKRQNKKPKLEHNNQNFPEYSFNC